VSAVSYGGGRGGVIDHLDRLRDEKGGCGKRKTIDYGAIDE